MEIAHQAAQLQDSLQDAMPGLQGLAAVHGLIFMALTALLVTFGYGTRQGSVQAARRTLVSTAVAAVAAVAMLLHTYLVLHPVFDPMVVDVPQFAGRLTTALWINAAILLAPLALLAGMLRSLLLERSTKR